MTQPIENLKSDYSISGNDISNSNATSTDVHETDRSEVFQEKVNARAMALEDVRNSAKKLKSDFLVHMESRLSAMMDDVMDSLQKTEYPERFLMMSDPAMMKDKRKATVKGKLPEKVFQSRPSPLTELLEVPHFKTIHHIFIAALVLVMIHSVLSDLLESHTVDLGFERLMWTFGKPLTTLGILLAMEFLGLFILYPSFHFWSTYRLTCRPETRRMIDYGAVAAFAAFLISFIYFPALLMLRNPLRPASGALVTMEQCRLLMKMYAFVRSNVPRALEFQVKSSTSEKAESPTTSENNTKAQAKKTVVPCIHREDCEDENEESSSLVRKRVNGTRNGGIELNGMAIASENEKTLKRQDSWISWDDKNTPCPSYSKFLYFYFAPTLIYKDSYPRTTIVRWDYVCWNFAQVFGCIFYANAVLGKYCSVYFSKFGLPGQSMSLIMLCNALFSVMLPSTLGLILSFFLLLHAWHNAFAEMLRFGDRLFYKDWWNCSSFSDYYKTWNILVHDWLYTYIFKDAWESGLGQRHKAVPTTLVFLVSSVFHEYILAFSLNFFLPVLLVLFGGFGFALVFIRNIHGPLGNIFMWMSLISGTGILFASYSMEYFARINCPSISEMSAWDFFIPRSFSCGAIQWSLK